MTVKLGEYSFKFRSEYFEVIVTCTFLRLRWRYCGNRVLTVMFFFFFLLQNVFDLFFFTYWIALCVLLRFIITVNVIKVFKWLIWEKENMNLKCSFLSEFE